MKVTLTGELFPCRKAALLLDILMRIFCACKRYAYQRLLEGGVRKELKKLLQKIFNLNSRYVDDAILEADETYQSVQAREGKPGKVIWGGKKLFGQLRKAKKKKDRKKIRELEQLWQDKRKGEVYARGDKSKDGNPNLRIFYSGKGRKFFLRITLGFHRFIFIPFFLGKKYRQKLLAELKKTNCVYSVRIIRRNGRYFIHITLEEQLPQPRIGFDHGALGIDLNAFPAHIAISEIDKQGNLLATHKIMTPHLYDSRANKRTWWRGEYARQLTQLANDTGKALILENLSFQLPCKKNIKSKKLRRILSNFSYKAQKQAIVRQFARKAILTRQVFAGYTSIIGKLKYQKMFSLSVHNAAAFVIARRGLGFKEKLTKFLLSILNCQPLVSSELGESTDGRNSARPLAGLPAGWSLWQALRKAVLTGPSVKPNPTPKGSGP
jgi:predicted transposase